MTKTLYINTEPHQKNDRDWWLSMKRGFKGRCPSCGQGALYSSYLKTEKPCSSCALELSGHCADDFPPYVTITIVGHIVLALALVVMKISAMPMWAHFALWIPATLVMTFALMAPVKGAIIGLQWAHRMHGFSSQTDVSNDQSKDTP